MARQACTFRRTYSQPCMEHEFASLWMFCILNCMPNSHATAKLERFSSLFGSVYCVEAYECVRVQVCTDLMVKRMQQLFSLLLLFQLNIMQYPYKLFAHSEIVRSVRMGYDGDCCCCRFRKTQNGIHCLRTAKPVIAFRILMHCALAHWP